LKTLDSLRYVLAVDRGRSSFTHSFRINLSIQDGEIWPQETTDTVYGKMQSIFQYIEPFMRDYECGRQTDRHSRSKCCA